MPNPSVPPDQETAARLLSVGSACETGQRRSHRILFLCLAAVLTGIVVTAVLFHFLQPPVFTHPGFDKAALSGTPEVEEKYGYIPLTVDEGYVVSLCGVPANDGQSLAFFLTNPKDNKVWLRAEVLDKKGNVLGSTGVLRQDEYLPAIELEQPLTQRETPVSVRIVAYEPHTWASRGNVSLNVVIYLNFR